MDKEFRLIKEYLGDIEKKKDKVSKANVGWHLDHSLRVFDSVFITMKASNSEDYKKEFNPLRTLTFAIGSFPRGKVRAPKRVLPPELISRVDIQNQLNSAIENYKMIESFDNNQYFTHPLFKQLNKKKTLKFLKLHTNHHLKIVRDILK